MIRKALGATARRPSLASIAVSTILLLVISACDDASMACTYAAQEHGNPVDVVAVFPSTVGAIRRSPVNATQRQLWPFRVDSEPATLCYLDGFVPKAAPGREPHDRVVLAVAGNDIEFIKSGYQESMQVAEP